MGSVAHRDANRAHADRFALECAVIRQVCDSMGLKNLELMIPCCRRVGEAPATNPEITEYLVGLGVASINVNPDGVLKTMQLAAAAERLVKLAAERSRAAAPPRGGRARPLPCARGPVERQPVRGCGGRA